MPDEELPEDLQPGDDNPLAEARPTTPTTERQDLGDPHIDGLGRDEDDKPVAPDTDASEDAAPRRSRTATTDADPARPPRRPVGAA